MPNVVKGSRQQAMVVVPYRPWRRVYLGVTVAAALIVTAGAAYWYGFTEASRQLDSTSRENRQLQSSMELSTSELGSLRNRLAIAEQNNRVDRQAIEESQATITDLRRRLSRQEQDVELYRQVLAAADEEVGLVVLPPEIRPGASAGQYEYRLVFRQQGEPESNLEARAGMTVFGTLSGENQEVPVYGSGASGAGNNLNFRYFQVHEGVFELPQGFQPERLEISAELANTGSSMTETFSWTVQENNNVWSR